ncbi:hypothetical protein [Microbacterium sp. 1P10AE]|uniref:hypothetical protein n=1 Tax=Microbacterium sp. 1P10AE TaxID=3132286 RepID=UPI0039A27723
MSLKRPRRRDYGSEPDWLNACLRYLDAKWPAREDFRKRIAAWQRWSVESDTETLRARIRDLILADTLTDEESAELDELIDAWKARQRRNRPTPEPTDRNR